MSIVLIGYRGSGKTTVGRALAQRLGWPFVDQDDQLVARAGLTIREIFAQHGEAYFRQLESQLLLESLKLENHVVSLGGGAVLAEHNRQAIAKAGHLVIYLRADADELHRRILSDPATAQQRPGLTHLGGSVEEIRTLLAAREPLYQEVQTRVLEVKGKSVQDLARQLHEALRSTAELGNGTISVSD